MTAVALFAWMIGLMQLVLLQIEMRLVREKGKWGWMVMVAHMRGKGGFPLVDLMGCVGERNL